MNKLWFWAIVMILGIALVGSVSAHPYATTGWVNSTVNGSTAGFFSEWKVPCTCENVFNATNTSWSNVFGGTQNISAIESYLTDVDGDSWEVNHSDDTNLVFYYFSIPVNFSSSKIASYGHYNGSLIGGNEFVFGMYNTNGSGYLTLPDMEMPSSSEDAWYNQTIVISRTNGFVNDTTNMTRFRVAVTHLVGAGGFLSYDLLVIEDLIEVNISGYTFSSDNSGTMTNDTWVNVGDDAQIDWANLTKTLNATVGQTVNWKVFTNDTLNEHGTYSSSFEIIKGYSAEYEVNVCPVTTTASALIFIFIGMLLVAMFIIGMTYATMPIFNMIIGIGMLFYAFPLYGCHFVYGGIVTIFGIMIALEAVIRWKTGK